MRTYIKSFLLLGSMAACLNAQEDTLPTTFLFAHGLTGQANNADWYAGRGPKGDPNWAVITGDNYKSFNFTDVGPGRGQVLYREVNIGQEKDINTLVNAYDTILHSAPFQDPDSKEGIVIIGSSRGAMTALNAAGSHHLPKLRAIVAEAPADMAFHVATHWLAQYGIRWKWAQNLAYWAASNIVYRSHNPNGIAPVDAVATIDKDVPILLVHSLDDNYISVISSYILYYQLLVTGHDPSKAFLLILPHGSHGKYNKVGDGSTTDQASKQMYQAAVHAFYKKFHIPYDPELAAEGEQYLSKAQPSLDEVEQYIKQESAEYLDDIKARQALAKQMETVSH